METIRYGGRAVAGFGLGQSPAQPTTVQGAARVSQSWFMPALIGGVAPIGGLLVGAVVGHEVGRRASDREGSDAVMGGAMLTGLVVGGAVGGALAARYGRRQDQAAAVLAQAQQSLNTTAI